MTRLYAATSETRLGKVSSWIEEQIDAHLQPLLAYAATLGGLADTSRDSPLTSSAVASLNPQVESLVKGSTAIIGSGFIAAPEAVDSDARYMLWLQQRGDAIKRLRLNFDTSDLEAYDYVDMDWYVRTRDRIQPTLIGPYLDYSGSDALVITLTVPVVAHGTFLGVVATDLSAQAAEDLITTELCRLRGDVVVVNRDRTIVATNCVRWMPGERVLRLPDQDPENYDPVAHIGTWSEWQIAVAKPHHYTHQSGKRTAGVLLRNRDEEGVST